MHRSVTVEELREHDTKHEEKWIAVEDVVFDVSNFKHPGGRNLLFPHLGTVAVGSLFFLRRCAKSQSLNTQTETFMKNHFWIDPKKFLSNAIVGKLLKTRTKRKMLKKYPISSTTKILKFVGFSKVILNLFSPYLALVLLIYVSIQLKRFLFSSICSLPRRRVGMSFLLLAYFCKNMFRRYLYKIADVEPGVFTIDERAARIAKLANLKSRMYRPHCLLWNADHLTIATLFLENSLPRIDFEKSVFNGKVAVDVAHPIHASRGRVAFLLPGVGGDSNSTYVRFTATSLLNIGYSVVVVHSRGLGEHNPHLENPLSCVDVDTLLDDFRDVIESFFPSRKFYEGGSSSQHYTHGVVVGFLLGTPPRSNMYTQRNNNKQQHTGGLLTSKYFGREGKRVREYINNVLCFTHLVRTLLHTLSQVPQEICAAVCVSGGFGMEFANWFRYRDLYQALIVPDLVSKMFQKYGDTLRDHLSCSQMQRLVHSNTYEEMLGSLGNCFNTFQKRLALSSDEIEHIDRNFLLMYSLDDPFHHPDMIGLHKTKNSNIIRLVTKRGGHVSWIGSDPETWLGFGKKSLSFMTDTVCDFVDASCMVCDCDGIGE